MTHHAEDTVATITIACPRRFRVVAALLGIAVGCSDVQASSGRLRLAEDRTSVSSRPINTQSAFASVCISEGYRVFGDWCYVTRVDEFDDSERGVVVGYSSEKPHGVLSASCVDGRVTVLLGLGQYYAGDRDDEIRVRYRFDRETASDYAYWRLIDNTNAIVPLGQVAAWIDRMRRSDTVILEAVDPFDGESNRHRFSLSGFSAAASNLPCTS